MANVVSVNRPWQCGATLLVAHARLLRKICANVLAIQMHFQELVRQVPYLAET